MVSNILFAKDNLFKATTFSNHHFIKDIVIAKYKKGLKSE